MTLPDPTTFPRVQPVLLPRRIFRDETQFISPYQEQETQEFLEDVTDLQDAIRLWNAKSGIPGLLNSFIQAGSELANIHRISINARRLAEVYFDFDEGIYRYLISGRRVPASRVKLGVLRVHKAQEIAMRDLTAQLVRGEITQDYWYNQMRKMMKDQYRASYIASIGGVQNYTRSEISRFGWQVRPQYRWLDNFLLELQSGKQPLNGFAVRRAGMYARAGNGIYQNSIFRIAEQNGKTQAKRVLGATDMHCHDRNDRPGCVELAGLGFVPMNEAVPIGDAVCVSHCLCSFRFR